MPKTIEIQVFKITELSKKARDRALDYLRTETDCSDDLDELFRNDLEQHWGITPNKVYFSLGHCHSDDVNFAGKIDLALAAQRDESLALLQVRLTLLDVSLICRVVIDHHGGNSHSMSVIVDCYDTGSCQSEQDQKGLDTLLEDLSHALQTYVNDVAYELQQAGYREIEYLNGEENLLELCESADYWFNEDGELVDG